jgi:hypothetical protein
MNKILICLNLIFIGTSTLLAQTITINEVVSSNSQSIQDDDGDFPDWIEFYFSGTAATDISGYGLSDDKSDLYKWVFPSNTVISDKYFIVFASGKNSSSQHTSFSISSSGESLYLTHPQGSIVDSVRLGEMPPDVSYGCQPDGSANRLYFLVPTPGSQNNTTAYNSPTPFSVNFSPEGGLYNGSVNVTLSASEPGAEIYYTLDGSLPTQSSTLASNPIPMSGTGVVRARVVSDGILSDLTSTNTYIIDKETALPVISLSASPDDLWDNVDGIYTNFESDREIPVHIEFFQPDGSTSFSQDAGMKIYGGWSRSYPQKSLALFARSEYGASSFNYNIFPDLPFEKYESFVLRNSGDDFLYTHMRDGMMQGLLDGLDLDKQAYLPTVIYLNGEYWGILNAREKLNEHYIEAHHGVALEDLDMLEIEQDVIHGDANHFNALLDYIQSQDMTSLQAYDHVKEQIDINSYLNYMASELYVENTDWPGWNLKYWRPRTANGKWRWIIYDLDFGFGLTTPQEQGYDNMFAFAKATDGDSWPNPPWSTLLFRKLLENSDFTNDFLNRYADCLNTIWQAPLVTSKITQVRDNISSEMRLHLERWGNLSYAGWENEVAHLYEFASGHKNEIQQNILSEFNLAGLAGLELRIEPAEGGSVRLNNNLYVGDSVWNGTYFLGIPVDVQAVARPGYEFLGWDINGSGKSDRSLKVPLSEDVVITARFQVSETSSPPIVINEINYHSAPDFDPGDWLELYNASNEAVDVSGWVFKDEDNLHQLVFPDGTIIEANDFLVLCQNKTDFMSHFPDIQPLSPSFNFGLSNGGELLRLFDSKGEYADAVTYSDMSPWPSQADGQGASLELISPFSDNTLAQNWTANLNHGTPGSPNTGMNNSTPSADLSVITHNAKNYPNPFNVETTISFTTPSRGHVRVTIFDLLGKQVASLKNEVTEPGKQEVVWQPEDHLEAGMYIYQIWYNEATISGIMIYNRR